MDCRDSVGTGVKLLRRFAADAKLAIDLVGMQAEGMSPILRPFEILPMCECAVPGESIDDPRSRRH